MGESSPSVPVLGRLHLRSFSRLVKLHNRIASGQLPNVKTLSTLLEVTERTVKRDIAALKDRFHAPVGYDKRQKGYFYTHKNWELPLAPLDDSEIFAFFMTIFLVQATGNVYHGKKLERAISKIASRLPEEIYVNFSFLMENISIQPISGAVINAETLEILANCASERRTVGFDYFSPNTGKSTNRKADILLLHNHEGDWYAIAFDHRRRATRNFRVDRISSLVETHDHFTPPKKWNRTDYLKAGFGMYHGGKLTEVEIHFDPHQAQWIRERQGFHPHEVREELPDGSLKLTFEVGSTALEAVARSCMKYAGGCVAKRPQELREIIREKLKRSLELY
ncbi:MAG: WYL domain-containing transcriptional regulator [Pyrinomonadaceae bacterium]